MIRLEVRPERPARTFPAWHKWPAALIPYRFRAVHRWWANTAGFFWLPCPLCGQPFGGHEWRDIAGKVSTVPDPTQPPTGPFGVRVSAGICPACTRAGRGADA